MRSTVNHIGAANIQIQRNFCRNKIIRQKSPCQGFLFPVFLPLFPGFYECSGGKSFPGVMDAFCLFQVAQPRADTGVGQDGPFFRLFSLITRAIEPVIVYIPY